MSIDKKRFKKGAMTLFFIVSIISVPILSVTLDLKNINKLNKNYFKIKTKDSIQGTVHELKTRKGGSYITLSNFSKISLDPSHNYSYENSFLDEFINIEDSLQKQIGNDTLFIYRYDKKYYFVLGEYINRKMK